jgi:hypothetical protein
MWDSFMTTRCEGANVEVSFSVMDASTGSISVVEVVAMLIRCTGRPNPKTDTAGAVVREKGVATVPALVTKCDEEEKARGVKAAAEDDKAKKDAAKREPSNADL